MGESEKATLVMLEWSRLCTFVAGFASTSLGRRRLLDMQLPRTQEEVLRNQSDTLAADLAEARYAANIDFGGVSSTAAEQAIRRVKKGGALTEQQVVAVARLAAAGKRLQRTVNLTAKQAGQLGPDSSLQPLLKALKGMDEHRELQMAVSRAISDEGKVRDDASDEVARTRAKVQTLENRLNKLLQGMNGEIVEYGSRTCLSVPDGTRKSGVVLHVTPGGSSYVEPQAAIPLNNSLAAARGEAYAAVEAVLWKLSGLVMAVVGSLNHILEVVTWMDTIVAKARYGRWIDGIYPQFGSFPRNHAPKTGGKRRAVAADGEEPWIQLRRFRHPLLLGDWLKVRADRPSTSKPKVSKPKGAFRHLANRKENMLGPNSPDRSDSDSDEEGERGPPAPVPIDICVRPETRAVIITGPNTGGKTASLKALGLAVLMARAGLALPASHPVILPPFASVLADIGDTQSLQSSLSTFSGHLKRIQGVRRETQGKSLVLLDEVGTGTDPGQGAALGIALLKALAQGGQRGAAFTLATTHHSALTSLKYEDPRFENASVEFDEERLQPTFRLLWGIPGRSNAINTAARIGILPEIVQAARTRLGANLNKVDNTISQLEGLRNSKEEDEDQASAMRARIARLEEEIAATRRQMVEEEARLKLETAKAMVAAVGQAESRLHKENREQQKKNQQQKREEAAEAERLAKLEEERKKEEFERDNPLQPVVGQTVVVAKMKREGQVLAVNGDNVTVKMGLLTLTAKSKDLRRP